MYFEQIQYKIDLFRYIFNFSIQSKHDLTNFVETIDLDSKKLDQKFD